MREMKVVLVKRSFFFLVAADVSTSQSQLSHGTYFADLASCCLKLNIGSSCCSAGEATLSYFPCLSTVDRGSVLVHATERFSYLTSLPVTNPRWINPVHLATLCNRPGLRHLSVFGAAENELSSKHVSSHQTQAASFLIFRILVISVWKFKKKFEFQKSEIFAFQKQFLR